MADAPPTFQVPAQARALLLSKDTYQQLHTVDDCVYGVISDLLRDVGEATEDTGYLRFVMTEQILVSGRHHALCAVDATRRALEAGHESKAPLRCWRPSSNMSPTPWMASPIAWRRPSMRSRKRCCRTARRTCAKTSAACGAPAAACTGNCQACAIVFHRFEQKHLDDLKPALRLRAGKLAQRLDGLDHTIVEMRERSRLLQEELHLKIEEQGNDNIRVLSVLTALLMPPTLITGIFGMNTKGLPFTDLETAFLWARC